PMLEENISELLNDFENGLDEIKAAIPDMKIPGGLTSTIWEKDNLIVKRDFSLSVGPSADQVSTLSIKGEQLLGKEKQLIDYTLSGNDETLSLKGDLSSKDGKIN